MRLTSCLALATMALASTVTISARTPRSYHQAATDTILKDHNIIILGDSTRMSEATERELLEKFYLNQFENTREPDAPYFLFMSRESNLVMGMGGDVKLRAYFDPGNSLPGSSFSPYDIPMERNELMRNKLSTTPAGTGLYFRVIGRNRKIGSYQVYIKARFDGGPTNDFKLNKAFATINDWTVGLATSTFSDGAAEPPTVDANGTTLSMNYSTLLVRWLHQFKKGFSMAASLETPRCGFEYSYQADGQPTAKPRAQSVPDMLAMGQYQWAPGQHVRLSGIVRWLPYRNLISGTNHLARGWGFQFSTVFNPVPKMTCYGTLNLGRSYVNNSGDFLLGAYDLIGSRSHPGKMCTFPSWTYLVGASYYYSRKCFSTVSFGEARIISHRTNDSYKYGIFGAVNFFYNLTPRIQFGSEFSWGKRAEWGGDTAWGRRLSASAQFSF